MKELLSVLADSHGECSVIGSYRTDTADSVCPPRVRAMLASRACRSSVMIGDPLGRNEMQKVCWVSKINCVRMMKTIFITMKILLVTCVQVKFFVVLV